jgi:hypothetical protein
MYKPTFSIKLRSSHKIRWRGCERQREWEWRDRMACIRKYFECHPRKFDGKMFLPLHQTQKCEFFIIHCSVFYLFRVCLYMCVCVTRQLVSNWLMAQTHGIHHVSSFLTNKTNKSQHFHFRLVFFVFAISFGFLFLAGYGFYIFAIFMALCSSLSIDIDCWTMPHNVCRSKCLHRERPIYEWFVCKGMLDGIRVFFLLLYVLGEEDNDHRLWLDANDNRSDDKDLCELDEKWTWNFIILCFLQYCSAEAVLEATDHTEYSVLGVWPVHNWSTDFVIGEYLWEFSTA